MPAPIRLSLIRKQTWLDGDRKVVGLTILLATVSGWLLFNSYGWYVALGLAVPLAFFGVWLGRLLYKADPYAVEAWVRQLKYRPYYAPTAHVQALPPQIRNTN